MGFNSFMTHVLLAANKEKNFDTSVPFGLAGRQSVFMDAARIENIAISYGNHSDSQKSILAEGTTDHETLRTRGHVTDRDFMKALFDVQTLSFDATDYEKTSTILDLNVPFNRQADGGKLLGTLDGLYDGGCLDNVWSPAQSLMNMSSLLQPGGRIFNWACSSGWPGAFCTVSPEWLLSFYALNDFRNIRVYHFHPIGEHSKWPNPTAAVFRYSPHFTRDPNYNPFSASMVETSHPSFVVAVAESTKYRAPEDWEMPMQSHYLFGDYPDWRDKYEEIEGLPFEFEKSDSADQESFPLPYQSDHFKFCGVIKGEAANVT